MTRVAQQSRAQVVGWAPFSRPRLRGAHSKDLSKMCLLNQELPHPAWIWKLELDYPRNSRLMYIKVGRCSIRNKQQDSVCQRVVRCQRYTTLFTASWQLWMAESQNTKTTKKISKFPSTWCFVNHENYFKDIKLSYPPNASFLHHLYELSWKTW